MKSATRRQPTRGAERKSTGAGTLGRASALQGKAAIFCEGPDVAAAAASALSDRRLSGLQAACQMGGLRGAKAQFATTPTPDLIVVESLLDAAGLLAELETLSEVCDAGTKVIVIGHVNDIRLYRELMHRHISDYLVAPLSAAQLVESIARALAGQAVAAPGRVVAFIGAKGGCGSSTVCHNTGWMVAESLGIDTAIADFDLAFGTLGLNFNQDAGQGMSDALAAGDRLDEAMLDKLASRCSDRLMLLAAPAVLDADWQASPERALQLVRLIGRKSAFLALDLPLSWTPLTQALIADADQLVLTAEPDLPSLRNAKNLIDACRPLRPEGKPPLLVLNKLAMPKRPEISARDFANAVDLEIAARLDFDAQLFGTAANNGLMVGEIALKGKAAELFRSFARTLAGRSATLERRSGRLRPLIDRLSRKLAV